MNVSGVFIAALSVLLATGSSGIFSTARAGASAAGEQPVDLARPTPLVPPGVRFPVEFQWAIDAYSSSTRHAELRNTRVNKILRTHLPNEPLLGISDMWVFVDQLGAGLSVFVDTDGTAARLPYLLYNVRYALRYRISDSLCGPSLPRRAITT